MGKRGDENHVVVRHKLCRYRRVRGCDVVIKESVVVAPKFLFRRIYSLKRIKTPELESEFTTALGGKISFGHSFSRRQNRVCFVGLRTCRAFFALGDCGLVQCVDCRFISGS